MDTREARHIKHQEARIARRSHSERQEATMPQERPIKVTSYPAAFGGQRWATLSRVGVGIMEPAVYRYYREHETEITAMVRQYYSREAAKAQQKAAKAQQKAAKAQQKAAHVQCLNCRGAIHTDADTYTWCDGCCIDLTLHPAAPFGELVDVD